VSINLTASALWDQAKDSPTGIRVKVKDKRAAYRLRASLYGVRSKTRESIRKTYDDYTLATPWDNYTITIIEEDAGVFLQITDVHVELGIEGVEQVNPVAVPLPRS